MSNISRSEYQRVCEENKRLLRDIRMLVDHPFGNMKKWMEVRHKWAKKFQADRELVNSLVAMTGGVFNTEDHFKVKAGDDIWIPVTDYDLDEPKDHPETAKVLDAANWKEKMFFNLENCQKYCDYINSI